MANQLYTLDFTIGESQCRLLEVNPALAPVNAPKYYQHRHPSFEVYYITSGSCSIVSNQKSYSVQAGQLILIPPGVYHYANDSSEDVSGMTLAFDLTHPSSSLKSKKWALSADLLNAPLTLDTLSSDVEYALLRLRDAAHAPSGSPFSMEKLQVFCTSFLLDLNDLLSKHQPQEVPSFLPGPTPQDYAIDVFFARHFNCNDASTLLAQTLNVSPRQLNRIIKKTYGINYREKLQEIRLEIATDFLSTTDKSISEIAELLGYSSPANFSSFVKNATGKTPSQIRKARRSSSGT